MNVVLYPERMTFSIPKGTLTKLRKVAKAHRTTCAEVVRQAIASKFGFGASKARKAKAGAYYASGGRRKVKKGKGASRKTSPRKSRTYR